MRTSASARQVVRVCALVALLSAVTAAPAALAQGGAYVIVNPGDDWVNGYGFAPDTAVEVAVDGVRIDDGTVSTSAFGDFWLDGVDIASGDDVSVTAGDTVKTHAVTSLRVTGISGSTLSGEAGTASVSVEVNDADVFRTEPVAGDGTWSVDVSVPGDGPDETATATLGPGSSGSVRESDADGDQTFAAWSVPNPMLTAHVTQDWIAGSEFGEPVTVTLTDSTLGTRTYDGSSITYDGGSFRLALDPSEQAEPWDVAGRQTVVVSGPNGTKTLVVADLDIQAYDLAQNTVMGTVDSDGPLSVWAGHGGASGWMTVTPFGGEWTADFDDADPAYDVRVTDVAEASVGDADGDTTMAWRTLVGEQLVFGVETQEAAGVGWAMGTTLVLTIDRPGTPASPDRTMTATVSADPGGGTWVLMAPPPAAYFDLTTGGFLVRPGDVLTMTGGGVTKTQTIPGLAVSLPDYDADAVSGTTDVVAGSFLTVYADLPWMTGARQEVEPAGDGSWTAWFGGEHDIGYASMPFAYQTDDDGDLTESHAPMPAVYVDPMADRVWATDFAAGDVTLTVRRGAVVAYETTVASLNLLTKGSWNLDMWTVPAGDLPRPAVARYDLSGTFDLLAGDELTVDDGTSARVTTVAYLTVDSVDAGTDLVTGQAADTVSLHLGDGESGFWGHQATPSAGAWSYWFEPGGFGNPPGGLSAGTTGQAIIGSTVVRWTVPSGFDFGGFLAPVDPPPTYNTVKAGAGVPVKFSLGGDYGLDVFAAGYPMSQPVTYGGARVDAIEQTVSTATSKLTYDAALGRYTYLWKTDKAWKGTARRLVLRFTDGSTYEAYFVFK